MQDETQALTAPRQQDETTIRVGKIGLVVAIVGALLVVMDLFALSLLGLVLTVVGAAAAFPFGYGQRWYIAVAGGAIAGVVAKLISGPHQTTGGWLAVLSVIAILVGSCLLYPGGRDDA